MRSAAVAVFATGCNALFGIHDLPPAPGDAPSVVDASRTDAPPVRDAAPAVALVQTAQASVVLGDKITAGFRVPPVAGDVVLLVGGYDNSDQDSVSGVAPLWTRATGAWGQPVNIEIWYGVAGSGGETQVTLVGNGNADGVDLMISEWTGLDAAAPLDAAGPLDSSSAAGGTASGGMVTTSAPALIVLGVGVNSPKSIAASTGLTLLDQLQNVGDVAAFYEVEQAAAGYAPAVQVEAAWDAAVAAFKLQ